tara:strand:+ start:230 stop:616 length:387 start_codon:yes stop_codon:yes gene_type:complete
MTISRASMGKQLKGNKMKKKKVKKMIGGGKLLGSISPLAGAISGKGMFGRALGKGLKNVSPLGALISKMNSKGKASPIAPVGKEDKKKNPMGDPGAFAPATLAVKAGGSLKRKRPIDGIAQRGRTRAK